jgi:hypothetical protein
MFLIPALVIKWIGALIKPINEFAEIVAPEIDEDTVTTIFETPIRVATVMDYSRISFSRVGGFIEQDNPLGIKKFEDAMGGTKGGTKPAPRQPDFIVSPDGVAIPIPSNATGPIPANNGKGIQFTGGSGGGAGLNSSVTSVRIMMPTDRMPSGYVVYANKDGQTVYPYNRPTIYGHRPGDTLPRTDFFLASPQWWFQFFAQFIH